MRRLVHRVTLSPDTIVIEISKRILCELTLGQSHDEAGAADPVLRIVVAASFKRRGVETKLVVRSPDYSAPDERLIALIGRSWEWMEQLSAGAVGSIREIARQNALDESDVSRFLPLAFLAPDIVDAMVAGKQPTELTSEVLRKACPVPYSWGAQRMLLGFSDCDRSNRERDFSH